LSMTRKAKEVCSNSAAALLMPASDEKAAFTDSIARFGGDSDLAVLHGHPISLYRVVKPLGVGYELVA